MPKIRFAVEHIDSSIKVVDEGMWWVTLNGFKPKMSKAGDSINFNPYMELTAKEDGSPAPLKDNGQPIPIFYSLNSKLSQAFDDFCHCFGLPAEHWQEGAKTYTALPGIWTPENEQDISKCEYKGPLVGRKGKLYLIKGEYNGQPKNEIKFFSCAIADCATRWPKMKHMQSLQF